MAVCRKVPSDGRFVFYPRENLFIRLCNMEKYMRYLFAVVPLLLFSCVREDSEREQPDIVKAGDILPDFVIELDDGRIADRNSLYGKPSLIVFFNTSCGDCRKGLSVVQRAYERYGTGGEVKFMAVSREQGADAVKAYWAENGLTIPFSAQRDRAVYHLFARSSIPRIYVSDASLTVRAVYTDSPPVVADRLEEVLEKLVMENSEKNK